jgi:hypothetical protein
VPKALEPFADLLAHHNSQPVIPAKTRQRREPGLIGWLAITLLFQFVDK